MKKKFTFILGLLLMFVFASSVWAQPKSIIISGLPEELQTGVQIKTYLEEMEVTTNGIDLDPLVDWYESKSGYNFLRKLPWGFWGFFGDETDTYEDDQAVFFTWAEGSFDSVSVNDREFDIVEISHSEKLKNDLSISSGAYYSPKEDKTIIVVAYTNLEASFDLSDGEGLFKPSDLVLILPTKLNAGVSFNTHFGSTIFNPGHFSSVAEPYILTFDKESKEFVEHTYGTEGNLPESDHYYYKVTGMVIDEILSLTVNDVKFPIGKITDPKEHLDLMNNFKSFAYYDEDEMNYTVMVYYNGQGELQSPEFTDPKIVDKPEIGFALNTKEELEFKIDTEYYLFDKVLVNGEVLDAKHYAVKNGSTIIILNYTYLNTLKDGEYEIEFMFANGSVKSSFEVLKSTAGTPVPKTIDYFNYYLIILIVSLVSLVSLSLGLLYKRKYKVI